MILLLQDSGCVQPEEIMNVMKNYFKNYPAMSQDENDCWILNVPPGKEETGRFLISSGCKIAGKKYVVVHLDEVIVVQCTAQDDGPLPLSISPQVLVKAVHSSERIKIKSQSAGPSSDMLFLVESETDRDSLLSALVFVEGIIVKFARIDSKPPTAARDSVLPPSKAQPASAAPLRPAADQAPGKAAKMDPVEALDPRPETASALPVQKRIVMFHDAENCFVPGDQPVDGRVLYDGVVRAVLEPLLGKERARTVEWIEEYNVKWFLYLHHNPSNKFHCPNRTLEDLHDHGITHIDPGTKGGAVDMKIKADIQDLILTNTPMPKHAKPLVVIISGDRDFAPELRTLRQAGFQVVLLHNGKIRDSLRGNVKDGFEISVWAELVDAARNEDSKVVARERLSLYQLLFVERFVVERLKEACEIHDGLSLTAVRSKGFCGLQLLKVEDRITSSRPSDSVCQEAAERLRTMVLELDIQQEQIDVQGMTPEQLMKEPVIRSSRADLRVLVKVPGDTSQMVFMQHCPFQWDEKQVCEYLQRRFNFRVDTVQLKAYPAKTAGELPYKTAIIHLNESCPQGAVETIITAKFETLHGLKLDFRPFYRGKGVVADDAQVVLVFSQAEVAADKKRMEEKAKAQKQKGKQKGSFGNWFGGNAAENGKAKETMVDDKGLGERLEELRETIRGLSHVTQNVQIEDLLRADLIARNWSEISDDAIKRLGVRSAIFKPSSLQLRRDSRHDGNNGMKCGPMRVNSFEDRQHAVVRLEGQGRFVVEATAMVQDVLSRCLVDTVPVQGASATKSLFLALERLCRELKSDPSDEGSDSESRPHAITLVESSFPNPSGNAPTLLKGHFAAPYCVVGIAALGGQEELVTAWKAEIQDLVKNFTTQQIPLVKDLQKYAPRKQQLILARQFQLSVGADQAGQYLYLNGRRDQVEAAAEFLKETLKGLKREVVVAEAPNDRLSYLLCRSNAYKAEQARLEKEHANTFPDVRMTFMQWGKDSAVARLTGPAALVEAAKGCLEAELQMLAGRMITREVALKPWERQFVSTSTCLGSKLLHSGVSCSAFRVPSQETSSNVPASISNGPPSKQISNGTTQVMGVGELVCSAKVGRVPVEVRLCSWEALKVDAITNAANSELRHTGGIAAVLANAAGPAWIAECLKAAPVAVGAAKCTSAGDLAKKGFKAIVHAVAPEYRHGTPNELALLRGAITCALQEAVAAKCSSVGIPGVGSGVFGWPIDDACAEIVAAVSQWAGSDDKGTTPPRVVLFDIRPGVTNAFKDALDRLCKSGPKPAPASTPEIPKPTHQWLWMSDTGLVPYDYDQNQKIEEACRTFEAQNALSSATAKVHIAGDRGGMASDSKHVPPGRNAPAYDVLFGRMVQENVVSKFQRKITRQPIVPGQESQVPLYTQRLAEAKQQHASNVAAAAAFAPVTSLTMGNGSSSPGPAPSKDSGIAVGTKANGGPKYGPQAMKENVVASETGEHRVDLYGKENDIKNAEKMIKDAIKNGTVSSQPPNLDKMPDSFQTHIQNIAGKIQSFGATVTIVDPKTKTISVSALGENLLLRAEKEVQAYITSVIFEASVIRYPPEWEDMPPGKENEGVLFAVAPGSPEWKLVQDEFQRGFPNAIVRIERVQNVILWQKYVEQRKYAALDNNGDPNEAWMKHGTRKTAPSEIMKSGFDMRVSGTGWFGRAAYFAYNTTYSAKDYRYDVPGRPGECQIFLARVARGKVQVRSSDRNIKKPDEGFSSIEGNVTVVDKAIMIYHVSQAYPYYLVTFVP